MDALKSLFGVDNKSTTKTDGLRFNSNQQIEKEKGKTDENNSSVVHGEVTVTEKIQGIVTRVIPLAEDDCLSCKLIGTSVMWGASIFVLLSGIKLRRQQTGFRKTSTLLSAGSLSFGMMLLGTARLFDLSIFQKDNDKSLLQLVTEDSEKLKKYLQKDEESKK